MRYPVTWYSGDSAEVAPCRFFHPQPFILPKQSEATGIAIVVKMEPVGFDQVVPSSDTFASEVLEQSRTVIDGKAAVRVTTRSTGKALLPKGVRAVTYYTDFGTGRTLVATTVEVAAAGTFKTNTAVLNRMMATLTELEVTRPPCSATGIRAGTRPGPPLPEAVSVTRQAIIEAALACDYGALAGLALDGERPFTHSYGDRGAPAEFWKQRELSGDPVLRSLVEVLDLPMATRTAAGITQYVWPSAFASERWSEIPPADLEALKAVYDEADLRRFEQAGTYLGRRVGITEAGEWLYYVAGD